MPHLLEEMEAMIEQPLITDAESNLIKQIREANDGHNFEFFTNPRQKEAFDAFLETLKSQLICFLFLLPDQVRAFCYSYPLNYCF